MFATDPSKSTEYKQSLTHSISHLKKNSNPMQIGPIPLVQEASLHHIAESSCLRHASSDESSPSSHPGKPSTSFRSESIPISPKGMKRTPSELKLRQDEELADFRDYVMFQRIVDRISRQQQEIKDCRLRRENDMCLAHVIGIRNGSEDTPEVQQTRYLLSSFSPVPSPHRPSRAAATDNRWPGETPSSLSTEEDEMFLMEL